MNQFKHPAPVFQPQSQPSVEEDFIDLRSIYHAIMRYKWGILGLAFVVSLVTGLVVYSMAPVYSAYASIILESQKANVVNVEEVYSVDAYDYNYSQTQYEILKSRNLAERVVRRLELHRHPAFTGRDSKDTRPWYAVNFKSLLPVARKTPPVQLSEQQQAERLIQGITSTIVSGLSVSPVEYSYMVYLSYDSTDPKMAAQIVNTLAQEFIDGNLDTRLAGTLQATDWLGERLEYLKQKLRQSELALQDFRDSEGLVDIGGITDQGGSALKTLSQRLQDASKARIEAQNIMEDVKDMTTTIASVEELLTIPAVLRHQLLRDLKRDQSAAERKAAELAKRYGPLHPKMISANSDVSAADAALSKEVRKVVSGIGHEYEVALRNEQQLQSDWESRKSEMQEFNRTEFQLQELQRDVEANRQLYDIFFTRVKSVSETGGFQKPHARIVDAALTPGYPVKPNKRLSITLAFILSLLLGAGIALLLDILDNTVKSPEDVTDKLQVPLLGVVPRQKSDPSGSFEQFWQNAQSAYAESIRSIRTGVVLSAMDEPAGVIVVTSTVPGEGKSTLALNLGAALGQMESTLVIGGDLRRPSLAQKCHLQPNHLGLSHFVSGSAELDDCIEHIEPLGIHVMPAGVIPPNPLEMISSKKFVQALAQLREKFDRIVIDSAPVLAVSDALILSSYADSVVYVVKADATPASDVRKGLASIVGSNEPLTGVVLNQLNVKRARSYAGGYYDGYYAQSGDAGQSNKQGQA